MDADEYLTLARESARTGIGGFRVPRFELTIDGVRPENSVLRDIVDITYRDNIDQIDGFELTVGNWDPARRRYKYIGSDDSKSAADATLHERETLFEPCAKVVRIRMGYGSELVEMLTGNFTTMEPTFSAGGPHTLAVRGLNRLHRLRRKRYDGNWHDTTDSAIARSFEGLTDPDWRNSGQDARRIPMPVRTDPEQEPQLVFVGQKNEYDIDFLWRRARIRGYVVTIEQDPADGSDRLYFGPSTKGGPTPYRLAWGAGLMDLKATLTTANQVKKVTVRGWDRAGQRAIEETADLEDPRFLRRNPRLLEIVRKCDPREERVVTRPVSTRNEARQLALDILTGHAQELVKIQASVVGLPRLRAGSHVSIEGIGARLSGEYFVTETTHTINASGYVTRFTARREDPDTGQQLVPGGTP
ncbi:phage late control D family protein [Cupriavidus oxalaticus]|jgi:phage protein D|uniref:phage late control D family protein n=1 Tax=Cupriavidus oxalaticus TaxID=96344 RepID=UPI004033C077